jgi:hypothetical protein
MKNKYNGVIRNYFSDYGKWLLGVTIIFVITIILLVALRGIDQFFWVIPVMFLIIYLMTTPLLILYCKVSRDIKVGNIEKTTVKILEIQYDDRFSFKNNGGATVGKQKYKIVDENHDFYLLSTANDKDLFFMFAPKPTFDVEIEFLKKSRLVLKMRIIEDFKTIKEAREQKQNIQQFRKVFRHYF